MPSTANEYIVTLILLLESALAPSTRQAYCRAWNRFCEFSQFYKLSVSRYTMAKFIVHLFQSGLSFSTINSTISGIAFWLKIWGFPEVTDDFLVRKLIAGVGKLTKVPDDRSGISLDMLKVIVKEIPSFQFNMFDSVMYATMFIWAYYACLRVSEFATGGLASHTLMLKDIDWAGTYLNPKAFRINFKTYKWSKGPVSRTLVKQADKTVCPVLSMACYLQLRGPLVGPLFLSSKGPVTFKDVADFLKLVNRLFNPAMR